MSKIKLTISPDKAYNAISVFALFYEAVFMFLIVLLKKIPLLGNYYLIIVLLVIMPLVYYSCKSTDRLQYFKSKDVLIFVFFCLAIIFSCFLYPSNTIYVYYNFSRYILPCVPFFMLGVSFRANEKNINFLSRFSQFSIIIAYMYLLYLRKTGVEMSEDSMNSSYRYLFCVMTTVDFAVRKKSIFNWAFAVAGIFYIVAMGARGPMLILLFFTLISIWDYGVLKKSYRVIVSLLAICFAFLFSNKTIYTSVLNSIGDFNESIGLSSRITKYLIQGKYISDGSGREDIFAILMSKLWERPFLGYGIYGEWSFVQYFSHNIYIEVLFDYGIILGSILILLYVSVFVRALRMSRDVFSKHWIFLFGCLVFVRGFFGGTHLSPHVFFLLGFCLNVIRSNYSSSKNANL